MLAVGGGSFLVAIVIGGIVSILMIPVGWYQLEIARRNDPARCPNREEAVRIDVGMGGWASPDSCTYYDAAGRNITGDAGMAGPVLRSRRDVVDSNTPAAIAGLSIVLVLGALGVVLVRDASESV